jgi:hypothetical protein
MPVLASFESFACGIFILSGVEPGLVTVLSVSDESSEDEEFCELWRLCSGGTEVGTLVDPSSAISGSLHLMTSSG